MAGNYSQYLRNQIAGATLCGSTLTSPTTLYFALFTQLDQSSNASSVTEIPTIVSYTRQPVQFTQPSGGLSTNTNQLQWTMAPTLWGSIGYVGLYDSVSQGNLIYWAPVQPVARLVNTGETMQIPVGYLTVTIGASY